MILVSQNVAVEITIDRTEAGRDGPNLAGTPLGLLSSRELRPQAIKNKLEPSHRYPAKLNRRMTYVGSPPDDLLRYCGAEAITADIQRGAL